MAGKPLHRRRREKKEGEGAAVHVNFQETETEKVANKKAPPLEREEGQLSRGTFSKQSLQK
jgi:hypothetical protein